MSRIIVPQRRVWTRQPQISVDLSRDAGDPLFIYNGGIGPVDLVTGASGTYTNSAAPIVTTDGKGVTTTAAAGARLKFAAQLSHSLPNGPWALFADFFAGAVWGTSNVGNFVIGRNDGVAVGEWQVRCTDDASTGIKFYQNQSGGASEQMWGSAGTLHNRGRVRMIIARRDANATSLNLWINGVSYGASTLDYGPAFGVPTTSSKSIEIGSVSGLATRGLKGQYELVALTSGKFPDAGLVDQFSRNPWQLFARRDRRTIIYFGASGTTAVYADSALTYYIRSILSSDSGVQYAIRNAIYHDDAVGYYLRNAIAQNNEVGYILRSAIAQDDAEAYKIRGLIQADDAESYNVRGLVQTTDSETYSIRGQVQNDATTNYDIQSSTSVATTNTASYAVRGSVASDGSPSYAVRGAVQSDASAGYSVRASAYRDVVSSYAIDAAESVVYADLTTSYSIDGVAPACPTADQIAAAVVAAIQTTPVPIPSNVTHFNGNPTVGSGTPADPVRPA